MSRESSELHRMEAHKCYEDNQGHCHNGCGRILNTDSARGYHGDDEYIRLLEMRMFELEDENARLKIWYKNSCEHRDELEDDLRVANELLDHYRAKSLIVEQMAKLPSGGRAESVLLSVSQWDNAGEEL